MIYYYVYDDSKMRKETKIRETRQKRQKEKENRSTYVNKNEMILLVVVKL